MAPARAYRGVPALFDGSPSSDPGGPNQITAYRWVFGDGGEYSGAVPIVFHTYASLGSYVASLIVTDRQGRNSAPYRLLVRVVEPPAKAQPRGGSFGEGSSPIGGVASFTRGAAGVFPDVTMASASLRASPTGMLVLLLYCPAGETSCAGTVTLRAAVAVAGGKFHRPRKTLVTLAKGTFSFAGGTRKQVALHLSRQALALLGRLHSLRAQALIVAHDPAGATHTTNLTVTLRAAPAKHAKH